jgi:hypothetical protein
MEKEFVNIELIEKYCEGKLNSEDRRAFENQLLVNEELKDEFELYKAITQSLSEINEDAIREKLNKIDKELINSRDNKETTILQIRNSRFYAIAASIILLFGLTYYFLFFNNSNQNLIASFEIEEPGLPVVMSNDAFNNFDEVMNAYKLNNLDESLAILRKIEKAKPENDTANYYIGVILSRQDKTQDAIPYLEKISNNSGSRFREKAMYLLGINYWKENNLDRVKNIFNTLSSKNNSQYSENARAILEHL